MGVSGSTAALGRFLCAPAREQFNPESKLDVRCAGQSLDTDKQFFDKPTAPAGAASRDVSFGRFRLFPTQFLLLEGENPVSLGSRALEILIVLLEHPGEVVTKPELMARVWPNILVAPSNLTVHISALRRTLRDRRDGNRFIINITGRGYSFVAPVEVSGRENSARATADEKCQSSPASTCVE